MKIFRTNSTTKIKIEVSVEELHLGSVNFDINSVVLLVDTMNNSLKISIFPKGNSFHLNLNKVWAVCNHFHIQLVSTAKISTTIRV